ncbi:MAG: cytochrome c oxidase subunit 3 [Proteobacteria bacterium]|nr:cytochrome c oxidase subunit 3 [Pseudomonadota bacterium]
MSSQSTPGAYYVPHGTHWPILGSFGLIFTVGGAGLWMNEFEPGKYIMVLGIACILSMMFGWFRTVIGESLGGMYTKQVDTSFRMGMMWFIFSEVMFFGAFFGALFYVRNFSIPWYGGIGDGSLTNFFLWKDFVPAWPTNGPEAVGGVFQTMPAWGVPLLNTLILLSSGVTITIAHHALRAGNRKHLLIWLGATVVLGALFLNFQAHEYIEAYTKLNLTLDTGIYGSTFFMLTGFHGLHVTLGAIMLTVIWFRCLRGHFTKDHHFAFEAVAWYWHFVDVVWLGLFIFVYVL